MKGQVVRVISGYYDILSDGTEYRTRGSGKLRKQEMSPVVGDWVEFEPEGLVSTVYERKNSLIRPKVANVDQVVIVTSLKDPNFSSILLDKFLAIIEFNDIEPIVLFTKRDLVDESPIAEYEQMGYRAFEISNEDPSSLETLRPIFKDKLTVFSGQTGAGKSSTINNLSGSEQETQAISKALGRGKHTTRVVEIIRWNEGYLIDTPGFSSLELNMEKLELANSYKIFKERATQCKFKNCLHINEKENICSVKQAVTEGLVTNQRYENYLRLMEEL